MRRYLLVFTLLFQIGYLTAQKNVVDKIIAVVGDEIILKSDIENEYLQEQSQGLISASSDYKAELLEQRLIQKLLLAQSKVDSIYVTESEVESEITSRIEYMIADIGSQERLEGFFGKPLEEIKNDMRTPRREQLIANRMQQHIIEKIRVTPSEVKAYFKKLPKDSLPEMPDKYEIQQIMLKPKVSEAEKERLRNRLREFREMILSGEKTFNTLAVLYSEDLASASRGGEMDYTPRTRLVPEFAEAAFNLKPGKISKIVETEYGFHIIQLIDRQGDKVKVRHILLQPKVSDTEKQEAINRLDTIRQYISEGKMTFEEAAFYFSTDKQTKFNGGLFADPQTSDSKISRADVPGEMGRVIAKMKTGDVSSPFIDRSLSGQEEFKIIKLKAFYPRHKADLDNDWMNFEAMLKKEKQFERLEKWIKEKQATTYIHLDDSYKDAKFRYDGWIK